MGSSRPRGRLSGVDIRPEALRQARTRARLSLSQVAGNELSRQTVHLIEIGKNRPSMRSLRVITERLAIPIGEVLVGPPESTWDEGAVNELEALVRSCHEEAVERAGGMRGVDIKAGVLRHARARAQLSLAQVGGNELTRQAVHLIETGQVRPSMHSLRVITDRLAIPINAVLIRPRGRPTGVDIKAEVLQQARARAHLSLAKVGGNELTRQAVHLIETGQVRPSMHTLRVITDRLAIPIDAVLIGPPESTYPRSSRPPPSTAEQLQSDIPSMRRGRQAAELARARTIVRELARAREQAGMTQAQVADRIGTTQSAVARLERAEVDPRLSTLVKYAAVVGRRVRIG